MLYTNNLEELIFERHNYYKSDELIVISGYLGPSPVGRLNDLPFPTKVLYGMYASDKIQLELHSSLVKIQNNSKKNLNIFYSTIPVHSKCYMWKKNNEIVHALVGSANFSTNGLTTPFREILAEITNDGFAHLNEYSDYVFNKAISCLELDLTKTKKEVAFSKECFISLLGNNSEVQPYAGLNWGQSLTSHVNPNDAYIPVRVNDIKNYPKLFFPKQEYPTNDLDVGNRNRHNDSIEIIWDDGTIMKALFEGSQIVNGLKYPKQISSFPSKSELGIYIRKRIGVPLDQPIRKHHLDSYGRSDIKISLLGEGVYSFDFSVN